MTPARGTARIICWLLVFLAASFVVVAPGLDPAARADTEAIDNNDTVAVDNSVLLDPYSLGPRHHHCCYGRGYFGDGYFGYWGERQWFWGRSIAYVDCSGRRGFATISDAVAHIAPYGEIRVLSGYVGAPCLETVAIDRPVRIVGDRSGVPVTVAAPPGAPCLVMRTDATVVLRDIRFVGHGHSAPCIELEEGRLIVRDVDIDSHGTDWAIDLGHGGELGGAHLHIATDGSGINANASGLRLADVAVDIDHSPTYGLMLERTDGVIDGLEVHGARVGLEASPGDGGLTLANVAVTDSDRGLRFRAASTPGAIVVQGLSIHHVNLGVSMGPDARVTLADGEITDALWSGIAIFHSAPFIHELHIVNADYGIWIAGGDENVELDGNRIEHTLHAPIHFETPGSARIVHNVLECNVHEHCLTGGDESLIIHADNTCIYQGVPAPCEAPAVPLATGPGAPGGLPPGGFPGGRPSGPPYGASGPSPYGPHGPEYGPRGSSYGGPEYGPSGSPYGPGRQEYPPGGSSYGGQGYGHGGSQYGSGGPESGAGGSPYGPGASQKGPPSYVPSAPGASSLESGSEQSSSGGQGSGTSQAGAPSPAPSQGGPQTGASSSTQAPVAPRSGTSSSAPSSGQSSSQAPSSGGSQTSGSPPSGQNPSGTSPGSNIH